MKIRTVLLSLLIAIACTSMLVAGGAKEQAQVAEGPTTLNVWYALGGTSGEAFLNIVKDYEAANPNVKINASYSGGYGDTATKITAALANKSTPDVLIGGQVTYSGAYGNFYCGEMAETDPEFNLSDVYEGLWEYGAYNGKKCNIPFNISTNMMFYNKDLTSKAGLDLEKNPPKTWNEFIAVCTQLKDFYSDSEGFIPFVVKDEDWLSNTQLMQCGNPVIGHNEDYSSKPAAWDSEECTKVAAWWQDMVRANLMNMTMNQNGTNVFLGGNAAFFAGSSTKIVEWSEAFGEKLGAIEMPYFDIPAVAMGGSCVTIFPAKADSQTKAAWEFVKFITGTEANAKFASESGYLPIRATAANTSYIKDSIAKMPTYDIAFKQLAYAHAYVNIDDYAAKAQALSYFRQAVTSDLSYDPLKALQESAERYNNEAND